MWRALSCRSLSLYWFGGTVIGHSWYLSGALYLPCLSDKVWFVQSLVLPFSRGQWSRRTATTTPGHPEVPLELPHPPLPDPSPNARARGIHNPAHTFLPLQHQERSPDSLGWGRTIGLEENLPDLRECTLKFVQGNVISKLVLWSVVRM